jgi:hypothetical protein
LIFRGLFFELNAEIGQKVHLRIDTNQRWEGRYLGGKVRRPAWAEAEAFEDIRCQMILRIKRDIPGSMHFGPGFFLKVAL